MKKKKFSYFFKNSLHFSSSSLVHFHLLLFWCFFLNPTKISRETWKKKHTTCGLDFFGWCIGWSSHVGVQSFQVEGRNQLLISIYVLAFITYKHRIPYLLLVFGINWSSRGRVRKKQSELKQLNFQELNTKLINKGNISKFWVTTLRWKTIRSLLK